MNPIKNIIYHEIYTYRYKDIILITYIPIVHRNYLIISYILYRYYNYFYARYSIPNIYIFNLYMMSQR
jgi:hypothetical protein